MEMQFGETIYFLYERFFQSSTSDHCARHDVVLPCCFANERRYETKKNRNVNLQVQYGVMSCISRRKMKIFSPT